MLMGEHLRVKKKKENSSFILAFCFAFFLHLKVKAKCSSKTSTAFQRTVRCYIIEDRAPRSRRYVNLRSYTKDTNLYAGHYNYQYYYYCYYYYYLLPLYILPYFVFWLLVILCLST
jgi:hypothetical protein